MPIAINPVCCYTPVDPACTFCIDDIIPNHKTLFFGSVTLGHISCWDGTQWLYSDLSGMSLKLTRIPLVNPESTARCTYAGVIQAPQIQGNCEEEPTYLYLSFVIGLSYGPSAGGQARYHETYQDAYRYAFGLSDYHPPWLAQFCSALRHEEFGEDPWDCVETELQLEQLSCGGGTSTMFSGDWAGAPRIYLNE